MRAALLLCIAVVVVAVVAAPPAVAQAVAGVVTDAAGEPLPGAAVALIPAGGGEPVAGGAADATGRYLLRGMPPGAYVLRVSHLGYTQGTAPLDLDADTRAIVDVELEAVTGLLDGVDVEVQRRTRAEAFGTLKGVGFYERRGRAMGRFIDRRRIEDRRPRELTDLFAVLPGFVPIHQEGDVRLSSINSVRRGRGTDCRPTLVLDGTVVRSFGDRGPVSLNDLVRIDDVEAVEAYAHNGTPPQYGGTMSPCGAILVWTRAYADPGDAVTRPPRR